MKSQNILLAAVGGQGLVLTTKIMAEAALKSGYDVKTNDVVGLSQRGGKIWGSVKVADKVYSPNIAAGQADILLGFEALEGRRWRKMMKPQDAVAIISSYEMVPTRIQQELESYPDDIDQEISSRGHLIKLNATGIAKGLGNAAVANILMLGVAAKYMEIDPASWQEAIEENVPAKFIDMNQKAFLLGYQAQFENEAGSFS